MMIQMLLWVQAIVVLLWSSMVYGDDDIINSEKYNENELCFLKYNGISAEDDGGKFAIGLLDDDLVPHHFVAEKGYSGSLEERDQFFKIVVESEVNKWSPGADYCELLLNALDRDNEK